MSDIFKILALMAVALAIFTIGMPYIPEKSLSKISKDITMIKNFLGKLSLLSLAVFFMLLVWFFIDLSDLIMKEIMKVHQFNGTFQFALRLEIVVLLMIIFYAILKWMWVSAKNETEHRRKLDKK